MKCACLLPVLTALALGCGDDSSTPDSGHDAAVDARADTSSIDADVEDVASLSDGGQVDGGQADGGPADGGEADIAVVDAEGSRDTDVLNDASDINRPVFTTSAPVIHLEDNLDEESGVGYCIDTIGRGFGDRLHAHSCKPPGSDDDVRYGFDSASGQIESAGFEGFCVEVLRDDANDFGLVECDESRAEQRFDYDAATLEFHPRGDTTLCMSAGRESRPAGLWMARDLLLEPCADVDAELRRWVVFAE